MKVSPVGVSSWLMLTPSNVELHLHTTRDGRWRVRIDWAGGRVVLGENNGFSSPQLALEAAGGWLAGFYFEGDREES